MVIGSLRNIMFLNENDQMPGKKKIIEDEEQIPQNVREKIEQPPELDDSQPPMQQPMDQQAPQSVQSPPFEITPPKSIVNGVTDRKTGITYFKKNGKLMSTAMQ